MPDSFGLKIGVEGEKEFKKALTDINQQFKVLDSERKRLRSLVGDDFGKISEVIGNTVGGLADMIMEYLPKIIQVCMDIVIRIYSKRPTKRDSKIACGAFKRYGHVRNLLS